MKRFDFKTEPSPFPGCPNIVRCEPDESEGYVTIRMATNGDEIIRSGLFSERAYTLGDNGRLVEQASYNPMAVAREECRLVLTDTDFLDPNGKPLEFEEVQGIRRPNPVAFSAWWDALPRAWAEEIYRCVVEVNPNWGFGKS